MRLAPTIDMGPLMSRGWPVTMSAATFHTLAGKFSRPTSDCLVISQMSWLVPIGPVVCRS
ncbi:Uncharacterised protein [Mycobacteroides abscessus subsp. abscessus]|nr:Uncharacterised protein [Mycobacteroides abscessus subsp. abscessus]